MLKTSKGNSKDLSTFRIDIRGNVQGVGFRPLVYRLAKKVRLKGSISNTSSGVTIEANGTPAKIGGFIKSIKSNLPHHARLDNISKKKIEYRHFAGFSIIPSAKGGLASAEIPPDLSICPDCYAELFDRSDRRNFYPFINCTNCGPRFTITKSVPYDRKNTTMSVFGMCPQCLSEYNSVSDRRFHAQPNACPVCGPKITLLSDSMKAIAKERKALNEAVRLLKEGRIIAVKGIGGYHLACDALNKSAVETLRERKIRPHKPFAVMVRDIETAKIFAVINAEEEKLLVSAKRPIVLLKKRANVPEALAPDNAYIGIMLPYAPLHYLLFSSEKPLQMLVMTSGNKSEDPISADEKEAKEKLSGIADYFLTHNRKIHNRCDDSIVFNFNGKNDGNILVRRSRGYVPEGIDVAALKKSPAIFAAGAQEKNTFCLTRAKKAYVSQYIGEMENEGTLKYFKEALKRFEAYLSVKPRVIAYDIHPDYVPTIFAKEFAVKDADLSTVGIQHHEAHIASVLAEKNLRKPVIGFAFDGTGLGRDNRIWGGECFLVKGGKFRRLAHFDNLGLPGGDIATKEIWRLGVSLLSKSGIKEFPAHFKAYPYEKILEMAQKSINSPDCSSVGRIFDAVASILDVRQEVSFEAQAAIQLESLALDISVKKGYNFNAFYGENKDELLISLKETVKEMLRDKKNGLAIREISAKFHCTIAEIIVALSKNFRDKYSVGDVVLSGGVFQNRVLLSSAVEKLKKAGFAVHLNRRVPPNDGGISLGQAYLAATAVDRD